MSRIGVVQYCIVAAACWVAPVNAQSIDPSAAALALHRPFALELPVRTTDALPLQTLARCVDAEFQSGSTLLFSDQMNVSLRPSPRDGWQLLVFEHPHVVREPVLLAHVVLRCPARFEREFIVQAEATAPGVTTPPPPAPVTATRVAASWSPRASSATPRVASPASAPPVSAPAAAAALDADRLRNEILRLQAAVTAAQLGTAKGATAAPATPIDPQPTSPPSATVADASLLDVTPAALRADPTLLITAALLAALLPLRRWWRQRCRLPRLQTMDIAEPLGTPAPAFPAAHPAARVAPPTCVILEETPERVDLIPPTVVPPGAASLADREAARFTHQVRGLVTDGYQDAAIGLLEKTLAASPARNPWLMLQLLELYETMGETGLAARLIGELQTLYRVQLPTIDGVACRGRSLQDMPALLREVEQAWEADDVAERLEDLIHRSPGPTWDLATFQDLLLLHAIAIDRAPAGPLPLPPGAGTFEPVLEWSVDEP